MSTTFKTKNGQLPLPIFFPDATRAVVRAVDSQDLITTKTPGILVNTYHLYHDLDDEILIEKMTLAQLMNWPGAIISDSGGFQVMSIARKMDTEAVSDEGVNFVYRQADGNKRDILFTPEKSIRSQLRLKTDLMVVLDDFTPPNADYKKAKETVERTLLWAQRSKDEFEKICQNQDIPKEKRPYLIGVVQGGKYQDLREYCAKQLCKIGFDGFGFGGWPIKENGQFDYESAQTIAESTPKDYFLYGLGIGKPEDIVGCHRLGYTIFDCVLPTRDARHGRLYVFKAEKIEEIDLTKPDFYRYIQPKKNKHSSNGQAVSPACDCLLCQNYSLAYLNHLFKIKDTTALRLATIHNLRFYSLLMEKLRD